MLLSSYPLRLRFASEMSVRMSNLDNERDERDEDSHEDRGISKCCFKSDGSTFKYFKYLVEVFLTLFNLYYFKAEIWRSPNRAFVLICALSLLLVSNTRFIAAVIERHTHTPERRRRYWGRSGTESDHGKTFYFCFTLIHRLTEIRNKHDGTQNH